MSEVKTNKISSVSTNGDITLDPDGTGDVLVASGNVGIGTTSPAKSLSINTSSNTDGIDIGGGGTVYTSITSAGTDTTIQATNAFAINTNGANERLRINNSGVVGIGLVPSGTEKLQVSGQIKASQDGSVSAPAFVINDGNTGFYRPSNNCIGFTTDGTERMRVDNGGKLTLATGGSNITAGGGTPQFSMNFQAGTTGPGLTIQDTTATNGNAFIRFVNAGTYAGQISSNGGTSMTYGSASDHRLKENVEDMTGAITRVKSLQPRRFSWIADDLDAPNFDGFLAHEAQSVVPEAVIGTHNQVDDDGNAMMQSIDQSKLVPLLTAALKESIAKIETLETEMTALKARVTALEDA